MLGAALALMAPAGTPQALAGVGLDPTFGQDGTSVPALEQAWEPSGFSEVAAQPDGGAIVRFGSAAVNSLAPQAIRRYRGDGSLDTAYKAPDPPSPEPRVRQADGKVLIAEPLNSGPGGFIVRLNSDGTRDDTFGVGGSSAPVPFNISTISLGSTGGILVGGNINKSYTGMHGAPSVSLIEPFVARFTPDGNLDQTFASSGIDNLRDAGKIEGSPGEVQEGASGMTWLSIRSPENPDVLLRLTNAGALDAGFGNGGKVYPNGKVASFHPVANGGILAVINREGKKLGFAVAENVFLLRYGPDGQEDSKFGSGSSPAFTLDGINHATAVAWGDDGSTLVGVSTAAPDAACRKLYGACVSTPVLARFTPEGRPDSGFGSSGVLRLDSMSGAVNSPGIASLEARTGGGYLVAGTSGLQAFLVAVKENGSLDQGFGDGGFVTDSVRKASSNFVSDIGADPSGRILIAGKGNAGATELSPPSGILTRLEPSGGLDRSFANGHGTIRLPAEATALTVDKHGRSLALIGATVIERITAAGRVDRSFGEDGFAFPKTADRFDPVSIFALPNGATLVAGTTAGTPTVLRLGAKGQLDRSFGQHGEASLAFSARGQCTLHALTAQRDGRVLIAGECVRRAGSAWRGTMMVGRLLPNGRPDRSFGHLGRLPELRGGGRSAASAIATQRGKILVAARLTQGARRTELLIRLNRDGRRDHSFAKGGIARVHVDTPKKLGVNECGSYDETSSILPTRHSILLVRDGVGPPVLAFRQNGRRDNSLGDGANVSPGRQIAPDCSPGPFGTRQHGRAVIAWPKSAEGYAPWEIVLQRFSIR